MKKLLLIAAILTGFQMTQAQIFQIGLRVGVNSSQVNADDLTGTVSPTRKVEVEAVDDAEFGYHLGLYSRLKIPIIGIYIQPEFLFTSAGGAFRTTVVENNVVVDRSTKDIKFSRIDIPIGIGYKFGPARLQVAPVASFVVNSTSDAFDLNFKDATWGYQVGVGLDIWKFLLDLKYEGSFSDLSDKATLFGTDFNLDSRASQFIVSVGYRF